MSTTSLLCIDGAYEFEDSEDVYDAIVSVRATGTVDITTRDGTTGLVIDATDWLALVAFVAAASAPAEPPRRHGTVDMVPLASNGDGPSPYGPLHAHVFVAEQVNLEQGNVTIATTSPGANGTVTYADDVPCTPTQEWVGPSDATILAKLRELSPDGETMPSITAWDAQRGSLPTKDTICKRTRRTWTEWATLAGLRMQTHSDGGKLRYVRLATTQEAAAAQPAESFRNGNTGAAADA